MQVASRLFVLENVLVDPLMDDLDSEVLLQPARDLLRAPFLADQHVNLDPGGVRSARAGYVATPQGKLMGLLRSITSQPTIASQLSARGGLVDLDNPCNLRLVVSGLSKRIKLASLFLSKLRVDSHLCSFDFGRSKKHKSYRSLLLVPTFKVALVSRI